MWDRRYRKLVSELPIGTPLKPRSNFEEALKIAAEEQPPDKIVLSRADTRPSLFDYQKDLVDQTQQLFINGDAALLSLPTGGGKTRTAVTAVLTAMAASKCSRVVWLAPTIELLDQASQTFVSTWRDFGGAPDITLTRRLDRRRASTVWLSTPQAVHALVTRAHDLGAWDIVVFDEAHQLAARTYAGAVAALRQTPGGAAPLLGLSATPGRTDPDEMAALLRMFDNRILLSKELGTNPVATLQRRGVLARLKFRRFSERSIANEAERIAVAARAANELFRRGRHTLVFTASVAGAYLLQDVLQGYGVPARAVDSLTSATERSQALEEFAKREIGVLINQRLLATGYDCPAVTDLFLLSETRSAILFEQMVGRAARGPRTGGSNSATVWEFDDHLSLHGLPTSYYRYSDYDWS